MTAQVTNVATRTTSQAGKRIPTMICSLRSTLELWKLFPQVETLCIVAGVLSSCIRAIAFKPIFSLGLRPGYGSKIVTETDSACRGNRLLTLAPVAPAASKCQRTASQVQYERQGPVSH